MAVFSKLKQFKDLRSQAKTLQSELASQTVHADAKGGKIQIVMDGNQKISILDIDASLLSPDKKKEVEDGVKEALENAMKKVQKVMADKLKSSGMELPSFGKKE